MEKEEYHALKKVSKFILFMVVGLSFIFPLVANTSWDSERINLENIIQKRVEDVLNKILPVGQFVVVVKVEPWAQPLDAQGRPIEEDEIGFYLPGVPKRKRYDGTSDEINRLVDTLKPDTPLFKRFIRRISTTLVLDTKIEAATVERVREITKQLVGLNPARGDTLDIQRTEFQKPQSINPDSGLTLIQKGIRSYWVLISLAIIILCLTVFFLFIFGPLRGFLNRFMQVLPTLKPIDGGRTHGLGVNELQQVLPGLIAQQMGMLPGPQQVAAPNFSGSLQVENPNKTVMPFGFIREDHLSNLAILLSRESPDKAAVVLGYLPPEWISRVLTRIEPAMATEIASQLATTKQLLPEQVEDIEQDLKRRLDYLVGVQVVFEHVGPATWAQSIQSLARYGRLVTCGATTGPTAQMDLRYLFGKDISVMGARMGTMREFQELSHLIFSGEIKPVIGKIFPLKDAAAAHHYMENSEQVGKILLEN
jgi:hypothetical protein